METIAVYWEPVIRTYGFHLVEGQVLCQVKLEPDEIGAWSSILQSMDSGEPIFRMVWAHADQQQRIKFFLLCDDEYRHKVQICLERHTGLKTANGRTSTDPVDLVYFHGPHFGDRYGIMDYTLETLAQARVPLLAAACSVATIYLVLPAGWGPKTKTQLSTAFEIPLKKPDERTDRDT